MSQNLPQRDVRPRGEPPRGAPVRRPKVSAATYWRRRVVVLGVGVGLLTTLSWAVNGLLVARSTAGQPTAAGGTRASGPERSGGNHASSPAASPSPRSSSARHRARRQTRVSGRAPVCALGGVTLRVTSPQYWYQPGLAPRFAVHAASSGGQPCRFNMGAKFVSVVITSGDRRLWSSADCVSGPGSNVVVLADGRPAVLRVTWDRRTSSPGCGGPQNLVRPGEYQVTTVAGALHSKSVNIVLGAKGASGP